LGVGLPAQLSLPALQSTVGNHRSMDPLSMDGDDLFGGIRLGYQPDELAKMFFDFVKCHPSIHKDLRHFQLTERLHFMEADERIAMGEHRLEWSVAHNRFCTLIEKLMTDFHAEVACTEQEFVAAIEEIKREGSQWWTPFSKLLDTSDYQSFSRMLQDNVCLCCGDPFIAYQSGELLRMFLAYMRAHPSIHRRVRSFQLEERFLFKGTDEKVSAGEHRLEWSDVHRRFVEIIEGTIKDFIKESNCNETEFMTAMGECMQGCASEFPPFAKLLQVTDYTVFAKMLQQDVCLCCGEPFAGYRPEELAAKLKEYMQAHPVIHEQLRVFQTAERHLFVDAEELVANGEHRLEWTDSHRRFLELIDVHIQGFLEEIHCPEEEFITALTECKKSDSSSPLAVFSILLTTADYVSFARMLQTNTCFCCGMVFTSDEDLAQMQQNKIVG